MKGTFINYKYGKKGQCFKIKIYKKCSNFIGGNASTRHFRPRHCLTFQKFNSAFILNYINTNIMYLCTTVMDPDPPTVS